MNNVYQALTVLARIIKIPNKKWVGLGGIAIAFGARGKSGAAAHYEPELRTINMSRKNGAGSLCHEWYHALDHRLGSKIKIENKTNRFASNFIHKMGIKKLEKLNIPSQYITLRNLWEYDGWGRNSKSCNYLKQAQALTDQNGGRKYWALGHELYARAFEAYIEDRLAYEGIDCPWLVTGTREMDYQIDKKHMHPYPIGKDRVRFSRMWNLFIRQLFKLPY